MAFTPLLEVAISLALLYLFFSQIVSAGFELVASISNTRGRYMRHWLNNALNSGRDKNWAELLYRHPSVDMLAKSARRPPPYVPSSVFAKAIVDLVIDEARQHQFVPVLDAAGQPTGSVKYQVTDPVDTAGQVLTPLQQFKQGLELISEGDFKALLRTILLNAEGCSRVGINPTEADAKVFDQFIHGLAVWYDGYMDRVSGWYKRRSRLPLFLIGLLLAALCNLDSIYVARYFWQHNEARQRVADYAAQVVKEGQKNPAFRPSSTFTEPDTAGLDSAAAGSAPSSIPSGRRAAYRADSLARRWVARTDSLTTALQGHGFPIGWTTEAADSALLPASFIVYQPATLHRPGWWASLKRRWLGTAAPTVRHPAYWLQYQRTEKPLGDTSRTAVPATAVSWQRDTLRQLLARHAKLPFRAAPGAAAPNLTQPGWLTALGWLLTAGALSFGAPFWFELLNRFVNMRGIGLKPPTSQSANIPATEPNRP